MLFVPQPYLSDYFRISILPAGASPPQLLQTILYCTPEVHSPATGL